MWKRHPASFLLFPVILQIQQEVATTVNSKTENSLYIHLEHSATVPVQISTAEPQLATILKTGCGNVCIRTSSSNSMVPLPSVSALSISSFSCFADMNRPKDFMTSPSSKGNCWIVLVFIISFVRSYKNDIKISVTIN